MLERLMILIPDTPDVTADGITVVCKQTTEHRAHTSEFRQVIPISHIFNYLKQISCRSPFSGKQSQHPYVYSS